MGGTSTISRKEYLSIGEFARLSRTSKDTLVHYDEFGLLKPAKRNSSTGYRYYSTNQIATANMIRTYKQLGLSLSEIKALKGARSPEETHSLFHEQIKKIDLEIEEWMRAKKLLLTMDSIIRSAPVGAESAMSISYVPAEPIVLGGLNDYSQGQSNYDALLEFYRKTSEIYPDLDLNYPVWGLISEDRVKKGEWMPPDRYYFFHPDGLDRRPASLYAIGYARGAYMESHELLDRLIAYIDSNGFEICGNAYEEYPLNEISVAENDDYLIRMMITVREKGSAD